MSQVSIRSQTVVLCILDGWGHREEFADNAVAQAKTPVFDQLWQSCPRTLLRASNGAVGLPEGQIGNSEVGHTTIGAGRVIWQDLPRISRALAAGDLHRSQAMGQFIHQMRASGGVVHLMGLASDGGVHSHGEHLVAMAKHLDAAGLPVRLHLYTDGRDVAPDSAPTHIRAILDPLAACPGVTLATLSGRYYPMDRDNRWERVEKAVRAMALAEGPTAADPQAVIAQQHAAGTLDEFIPPHVMTGYTGFQDGDGILSINFRTDRMRQILSALLDPGFSGFDVSGWPRPAAALGMVRYSDDLAPLIPAIFEPVGIPQTLGEVVAAAGLAQLRLAETEKYPHVTFFLNGGRDAPYPGEERILVPSPKVATYDLQPEMSAPDVGQHLAAAIREGRHRLIVINFANPDMVGHSGDLAAAIRACEAVDKALGQAVAAVRETGAVMLVTADHGNAEMMRDPVTGGPHTAHTLNPVPLVMLGAGTLGLAQREDAGLADLAPTLLSLMGLEIPVEMEGRSLVTAHASPLQDAPAQQRAS